MSQTKIMTELDKLLKEIEERYYLDGILNKARVIEDLYNYEPELIKLLNNSEVVQKHFMVDINGNKIIKLNQLIEVFEMSEYWDNSYTAYENRIGLTSNNKFLSDDTDVVLNFPYKDTVLKAAMSKEERKKEDLLPDEPFFNEKMAREEIDTLFDNKVLVNATKYDEEGSNEVRDFLEEDNLILKGNNLLALHSIENFYKGRVKLIYIDPPYNLKGDSFKYNDKFTRSTWLTFMKNRLQIAASLLSEEGSIWISISDKEMHYLKVLMDEVFGEESFVATLPRKTRDGKSDVPFNLSQDFDWLLVYTKGAIEDAVVGRSVEREYYETDDFPGRPWRKADMTKQTTVKERPNSDFTMVNPKSGKEYPVNPKRSWAVTKDTFHEYYDKGGIGFPDDYDFMSGNRPFRRVFKDEDDQNIKPTYVSSDFLIKDLLSTLLKDAKNQKGNDQIDNLFSRDDFDYAKPEELIKAIIEVTTDEKDIVLDFFMGSATTQAVAHKMNRRYIGIEQMGYINTVSVPRLQKVIEGEQGGISKDVDWHGGGSFVYAELMEKNTGYLKDILEAESTDLLREVFNLMLEHADFDFRVDLVEVKESVWRLPLEDQKRTLVKIIDKNQLYYNYSEIDDENVRDLISESDYEFNMKFYNNTGDNDE